MRVSKQAAAENRRRILIAAAQLFREHGIDGTGVDTITEAAGLTHGAFYSQFESKQTVVAEALRLVLDESRERWARNASGEDKGELLERFIDTYLSQDHRDSPGVGCAVAALGSEIARQPKQIRAAFSKTLEESLDLLAGLVPARTASGRYAMAIQHFSALVGALILARAVDDEALSRRILQTVAKGLKGSASS